MKELALQITEAVSQSLQEKMVHHVEKSKVGSLPHRIYK